MAKTLTEQSQNKVVTISGNTVNRRKCRLIEGAYYEIGVDVVEIEGVFYRLNTGKVFQDFITKEWKKLTSNELNSYYVIYTKENIIFVPRSSVNASFIKKHNLESVTFRYTVSQNGRILELSFYEKDASLMYKLGLLPKFSDSPSKPVGPYDFISDPFKRIERHVQNTGRFVDKFITSLCNKDPEYMKLYSFVNNLTLGRIGGPSNNSSYGFSLVYNYTDNADYIKTILSKGPYVPQQPCDFHREFYSFFDNYTYGIEYETAPGNVIDLKDLEKLQWVPLRDGSLRTGSGEGIEYVSSVLNSNNLIQNMIDFMSLINNNDCKTSILCSIHVNIGVPTSKLNDKNPKAAELYGTALKLQDQIFELIAPYKSSHSYQKQLAKNYCKKLPNGGFFNLSYSQKEKFVNDFLLGGSKDSKFGIKTGLHPNDGGNKWDNAMRYYWFNLLPTYFGKKKGVIEFRPLEPTKSFATLFCWTTLYKAIIQFALDPNNFEVINSPKQKIDLQDVIDSTIVNPLLRQIMMLFIQNQKQRYIDTVFHSRDTTQLSDSMFRQQLEWNVTFPSGTPNISTSNLNIDDFLAIYNKFVNEVQSYKLKEFIVSQFQNEEFARDLKIIGFNKFSTMVRAYSAHHLSWINIFAGTISTSEITRGKVVNILKLPAAISHTDFFEFVFLCACLKASNNTSRELSKFYNFEASNNLVDLPTFLAAAKKYGYVTKDRSTILRQSAENVPDPTAPTF